MHRDIKPDNIFISPSGSYKLGDFGIARIIEDTTLGLSRKGTYEYMAPEVYWGHDYGASVDLYSLGLVMYRYLNEGRMPFMPPSPEAIHADDREDAFIMRVNGHDIPEPRNGSQELKRIVLKACEHDRAKRYQDADEMLQDLVALKISEISAEMSSRRAESALISAKNRGKELDPAQETAKNRKESTNTARNSEKSTASAPGTLKIEENQAADTQNVAKKGKNKRKTAIWITAVLGLCLIIAGGVWLAIPKEVTDIDVGYAEGSDVIYIGDDLVLSCTVIPDRFKDEPVSFVSSDENIITVDENGVVHAHATGETTLTMTAKEYSEIIEVIVVPKVTSIGGIDEKISLTTGDTLQLKPELEPEEFADEPVSYSSGDKKVAKVSKDGKLTAVAAGETTLTLDSGGCTFEASVSVSDPVVYYTPSKSTSSTSKKKSSKSTKKKSSSKSKKGYFSSDDDEHF